LNPREREAPAEPDPAWSGGLTQRRGHVGLQESRETVGGGVCRICHHPRRHSTVRRDRSGEELVSKDDVVVLSGSAFDLARETGLDVSFAARLLRLMLLPPDVVEAILLGEEPSGFSLTKLTKGKSAIWREQRREFGFKTAD